MKQEDKKDFRNKLERAAIAVGRKINSEEIDVFFMELIEYPINVVLKAIDKALCDRSPDDVFIRTQTLVVSEIRKAIKDLLVAPGSIKVGCEKCSYNTWILEKVKGKSSIAHRCECWLTAMAMKKESQKK